MQKHSIFKHYFKIAALFYCCSSCALLEVLYGPEKSELGPKPMHIISKGSFFRMSFPYAWQAVYKDIDTACELYMTGDTAFCYVEVFAKEDDIEQVLCTIKDVPIVKEKDKKAKNQETDSEVVWRRTKFTDELTTRQIGYDEFYQTFWTTQVTEADEEFDQLNIAVRVIEGKDNYYIINVGNLSPRDISTNKIDEVPYYILRSFKLLKDAPVEQHIVDAVLSDRLQWYQPSVAPSK